MLFFNNGNGSFALKSNFLDFSLFGCKSSDGTPQQLTGTATADVDGDGHVDLIFACRENVQVLANVNGNGTFVASVVTLPPRGSANFNFQFVTPADVDGDGDIDLALCNTGANELLINDGNGTFTVLRSGSFVSSQGSQCNSITAADADGDGGA